MGTRWRRVRRNQAHHWQIKAEADAFSRMEGRNDQDFHETTLVNDVVRAAGHPRCAR